MSNLESFQGKVIWFNPKDGFGFIGWSKNGVKQKDMFLHFSDICCEGFKTVKKDQIVSFNIGANNQGVPKAINVMLLG